MENPNAEKVVIEIQGLIKALKANNGWWENRGRGGWFNHDILEDALALITSQEERIKELTEENERLTTALAKYDLQTEVRIAENYYTAEAYEELSEENERLKAENENKCKDCAGCISDKCDCANIEAYAVEKYKSAIIEYYSQPKYQPTKEHPIKHTQIEYLFAVLDQIAKEMLEGEK